ncbi:mediator of RNA polymerase II transcription subunit 8, partial [Microcaecilia unicolor]|uniref:Mediator of RNA polymerase II transcription subunit 8 n=1 Tax=Microcaecilia unicolor TaxID=1415580 RepID=A0A6P7YEZ2_9AMPH
YLPISSSGLRQNKQTFNPADTNALVAAVTFGKGLSNRRPPVAGGSVPPNQAGAGSMLGGTAGMQQVQMPIPTSQQQGMVQPGQPGKIPSNIKTNIKSASMHPYQR